MAVAAYQLKSELARFCLPAPERDSYRRLAWVNSLCLMFLLIGVFGAQNKLPVPKHAAPLEQPVPVVIEPLPATPPPTESKTAERQDEEETPHGWVNAVSDRDRQIARIASSNLRLRMRPGLSLASSQTPVPPPKPGLNSSESNFVASSKRLPGFGAKQPTPPLNRLQTAEFGARPVPENAAEATHLTAIPASTCAVIHRRIWIRYS